MWSWSEKKPSRAGGVFRRRCAWMGTAGAAGSARERGGALSAGPGGSPGGCGEALPRGPAAIPAPAFVCGRSPGARRTRAAFPSGRRAALRAAVAPRGSCGGIRVRAWEGGGGWFRRSPAGAGRRVAATPGGERGWKRGRGKTSRREPCVFFLLLLKPRVGRISISLLFPARSRTPPPLCPHRCSLCPGRGGSGTPTYRGAAFAVHLPLPFTGAGAASAPAPFSGGAAAR